MEGGRGVVIGVMPRMVVCVVVLGLVLGLWVVQVVDVVVLGRVLVGREGQVVRLVKPRLLLVLIQVEGGGLKSEHGG